MSRANNAYSTIEMSNLLYEYEQVLQRIAAIPLHPGNDPRNDAGLKLAREEAMAANPPSPNDG